MRLEACSRTGFLAIPWVHIIDTMLCICSRYHCFCHRHQDAAAIYSTLTPHSLMLTIIVDTFNQNCRIQHLTSLPSGILQLSTLRSTLRTMPAMQPSLAYLVLQLYLSLTTLTSNKGHHQQVGPN